jgi:hypothetical protein
MRLDHDGRLQFDAELVEAGRVTESPRVVLTRVSTQARN